MSRMFVATGNKSDFVLVWLDGKDCLCRQLNISKYIYMYLACSFSMSFELLFGLRRDGFSGASVGKVVKFFSSSLRPFLSIISVTL